MQNLRIRANRLHIAQILIGVLLAANIFLLIGICGGLERDTITLTQASISILVGGPLVLGLAKLETVLTQALEDTYSDMDDLEQRHIERAIRTNENAKRISFYPYRNQ